MGKSKKYDWKKLQDEFDDFRLQDKTRSLKDFANERGLSYIQARRNIKVTKSKQKTNKLETIKEIAKQKELEKIAVRQGIDEAMNIRDLIKYYSTDIERRRNDGEILSLKDSSKLLQDLLITTGMAFNPEEDNKVINLIAVELFKNNVNKKDSIKDNEPVKND